MAGDMEQLLEALQAMEEKITRNINDNIDKKFECLQRELHNIRTTNEEQEKRISYIEKQMREKNLIFFGVPEGEKSYQELETIILQIINNNMKIDCRETDIEKVQRMGKKDKDAKKIRPINVTFVRLGMKIKVLKCKKSLEGSDIYFKPDYPPKVLEIRKTLQEQVKKERNQGRQAVIRYDKIIITKNNGNENAFHRSNAVQKRPFNISPTQTTETTEHPRQQEKKNKTISYDIRQYTRNINNETPNNQ